MRRIHLALSAATLALLSGAGTAFAHPPHWAPAHGYRAQGHAPRVMAVAPRWVRIAPPPAIVYRAPVRRVHVVRVVRPHRHDAAAGALAGAIAGALIGGSLAHGEQHLPAVAVGSVIGAVVGHEIAGGH